MTALSHWRFVVANSVMLNFDFKPLDLTVGMTAKQPMIRKNSQGRLSSWYTLRNYTWWCQIFLTAQRHYHNFTQFTMLTQLLPLAWLRNIPEFRRNNPKNPKTWDPKIFGNCVIVKNCSKIVPFLCSIYCSSSSISRILEAQSFVISLVWKNQFTSLFCWGAHYHWHIKGVSEAMLLIISILETQFQTMKLVALLLTHVPILARFVVMRSPHCPLQNAIVVLLQVG